MQCCMLGLSCLQHLPVLVSQYSYTPIIPMSVQRPTNHRILSFGRKPRAKLTYHRHLSRVKEYAGIATDDINKWCQVFKPKEKFNFRF